MKESTFIQLFSQLFHITQVSNFYGINYRKYYNTIKNGDLSYAANNYNKLSCVTYFECHGYALNFKKQYHWNYVDYN